MKKYQCSGHGDYIESIENKVRIEDIVMEAIDGTIPDSFIAFATSILEYCAILYFLLFPV